MIVDDIIVNDSSDDDDAPAPMFAELGVPGPIVRVLDADGKKTAFPIQADTLPDSLAGRDVLGRGRTGSGKTLAFAIPMVARLGEVDFDDETTMSQFRKGVRQVQQRHREERMEKGFQPHPRGLIMAPTRELANQINDVLAPIAAIYGIETTTVYGGVRYQRQINDLRAGADIVVACPGRLEDLVEQGQLTLSDVRIVVLDEADEMADMGFLPPIKRILSQISDGAQHMLFSATLDHGVDGLVRQFLEDPKVHSVDEATSAVDSMTHHVFEISRNDKPALVKLLASGAGRRILFTRTKFQAKKLAKTLTQAGIPAAELHGNLSQNQRDRNLAAFEEGDVNVLVATDVAARGIDVSNVGLVVQVDPPEDSKSFLHRSGRTARAGKSGDVVTIMTTDQRRYVKHLVKQAGIDWKPVKVTLDDPLVMELVGEVAEPVFGWNLDKTQPAGGRGKNGRGGRNGRNGGRGGNRAERRGNSRGGLDERTGSSHDRKKKKKRSDSPEQARARKAAKLAKQQEQGSAAGFSLDSALGAENQRHVEAYERRQEREAARAEERRADRIAEKKEAARRRREEAWAYGDDRFDGSGRKGKRGDWKPGKSAGNGTRKAGNGGKRIHRDENVVREDLRGEDAKRHERRQQAHGQFGKDRPRKTKNGAKGSTSAHVKHQSRHNAKKNANPFRSAVGKKNRRH
ncbi:DEAD/DEAH box helicase [Bifidobacterium sp. BRDM6]|uniref:DEAD/DEAH box helicase n=1 Tax=Bifidobacterium choloepi TaxID=2614131 RepID=A0A6I5MXN6_9BIFI|nr:DEAD/DEAH box helicase [Bifidobacterium choloepi]